MFYLFFIIGLIVGSFLNVVILRLEKGEGGILKGRSHCPKCGKILQWFELIPLVSYIIQKAECRHCKKPISLQYPLVEFFTGLLFALLFLNFGFSGRFFFLLLLSCLLIILFVSDVRTQMIPDKVAHIGIGVALAFVIFQLIYNKSFSMILNYLAAVALGGGFFALLVFISKETWMGKGDIKIGILMGLLLGYPQILVALFLAFVAGALVSIILVVVGKKTLKSQIPFGPFLIFAAYVTIFYGERILDWYLRMMI